MTVKLLLEDPSSAGHLDAIARTLMKSRKIIMITGAGVSCNAGIPDFRSDDGLYAMVKHQHPDAVVKGKDLFDTVLFSSPTTISIFFTFMASLRRCILQARCTPTHKFIRLLKEKKKLLRCYTQNIDGLESQLGLSVGVQDKWKELDVVQLHGDINTLKCMQCMKQYAWETCYESQLDQGEAPLCPCCETLQEQRALQGKRYTGVGCLRPDIVLYGEDHPQGDLIGRCTSGDLKSRPDLLIISGTSLKVLGIRKLVRDAAKAVKSKGGMVILINKTSLSNSMWKDIIDYHIESDCDDWVAYLKTHIPDFFLTQAHLNYKMTKRKSKGKIAKVMEVQNVKCPNGPGILSPPSTPRKPVHDSIPFVPEEPKSPDIYDSSNDDDLLMGTPPSSQGSYSEPEQQSPCLKAISNSELNIRALGNAKRSHDSNNDFNFVPLKRMCN